MRFVLDNRVAMCWLLNDRLADIQEYARAVLAQLAGGTTAVDPNLFAREATNVLVQSQKRA